MATIFYSWQSDRPNKLNRGFIEKALRQAIKRLNVNATLEEAIRFDQGTLGVPGSPPVADTILQKIAACDVYVPDLTFVQRSLRRQMPNPNVLIEYGFARAQPGLSRIVGVFNTAFGKPENLPFDIKYVVFPACYTAHNWQGSAVRIAERNRLVDELSRRLRDVLTNLPKTVPEDVVAMPSAGDGSAFLATGDVILSDRPRAESADIHYRLGPPPRWFLRLIPMRSGPQLFRSDGMDLIHKFQLANLFKFPARIGMNKYGAVCIRVDRSDIARDVALGFVHVFRSGELWFADNDILTSNTGTVPAHELELFSIDVLQRFLAVAKDIGLRPPLRVIAGITGAAGRSLALRFGALSLTLPERRIFQTDVIWEGRVDNYEVDPDEALHPYFREVWDAAGLSRPSIFRRG